jgi:hypothetical protein
MSETNKFSNIAAMLLGILGVGISLRMLLRHQYVTYEHGEWMWTPTIGILILGAWFFLIGLVGLINEKRRNQAN